ncbi:MAG TPA: aldehyde dehydrogenase family protein, partial [Gemmatimonadaceae bacterium]|nr:aldehyde dehydrogenase family protein [Gemmatimonadaceae bacterium]
MKYPEVRNYLDGSFVGSDRSFLEVHNPSDGSVISRVPLSTQDDVDAAVASAAKAFPAWSATPIKERVQVFYRYKTLLEKN